MRYRPRCRRSDAVARTVLIAALSYGLAGCATTSVNPQVIEDARTAARITTALVNDPQLGPRAIDVRVTAGVAHLTGRVFTEEEAARLEQLVRAVAGVTDVQSKVRVTGPPLPQAPVPATPRESRPERVDEPINRRLLAIGGAVTFRQAQARSLEAGTSIGPLIRFGSRSGLGVDLGFNWVSVDLVDDAAGADRLARVRIRPVMAGAGYTSRVERVAATISLVGGYSFNSLRIDNVAAGPRLVLSVDNSFAWRPGLSLWFEINDRVALNAFGGYLVTRPLATFLDGERLSTRALRANTSLASLGLVYKLF